MDLVRAGGALERVADIEFSLELRQRNSRIMKPGMELSLYNQRAYNNRLFDMTSKETLEGEGDHLCWPAYRQLPLATFCLPEPVLK